MKELLISGIALVIIPTLLIIVVPLIDKILTDEVIEIINNVIDQIAFFIGSNNTNLLFACIGITIIMLFVRRLLSFFIDNKEK